MFSLFVNILWLKNMRPGLLNMIAVLWQKSKIPQSHLLVMGSSLGIRSRWLCHHVTCNIPLCLLLGWTADQRQSIQSISWSCQTRAPIWLSPDCTFQIVLVGNTQLFTLKMLEGSGWGSITLRKTRLWWLFIFKGLCFSYWKSEISSGSKIDSSA